VTLTDGKYKIANMRVSTRKGAEGLRDYLTEIINTGLEEEK